MKLISTPAYTTILKENLLLHVISKGLQQEGNIVYEYNPFRNYRLTLDIFEYKNKFYTLEELGKLKIFLYSEDLDTKIKVQITLLNPDLFTDPTHRLYWTLIQRGGGTIELNPEDSPILRRNGELADFDTNELNCDLQHPIDIKPQYSYDGSVNLILNDGKNIPRLINSRFSALGKNKYLIVDRKGDNDTNIYDQGSLFDIDTSLYKKTSSIPNLYYYGTFPSGNLPIGTYHFYFKYMDADGNETDFIAESGKIQVFIGELPLNINSGFRNLNSFKGISMLLTNLDSGYLYISVYYTRATSDILENNTINAFKIDLKFIISSSNVCNIKISGFEEAVEIPISEINLNYLIASKIDTLEICLNRLFFGNISKQNLNYQELTDLSLRILPYYTTTPYNISNKVDFKYRPLVDYGNSYYRSKFIYEKTGYWPDEIYRFGIVYILKDNTLSPVYNVRGVSKLPSFEKIGVYSNYKFYRDEENGDIRNYIAYDDVTNLLIPESEQSQLYLLLENKVFQENCKGVVLLPLDTFDTIKESLIYGIGFYFSDPNIKITLDKLGIRGFFFVRQKRIPTTLCLAYTIGIDKISHTPVIPFNNYYIAESFLNQNEEIKELSNNYKNHTFQLTNKEVNIAAICPDYDLNSPYFNTIFNGDLFVVLKESLLPSPLKLDKSNPRHYYTNKYNDENLDYTLSKLSAILAVEDNVKLVSVGEKFFSARAGEAEEAFRFEFIGEEKKGDDLVLNAARNLVRGSFGPYLAFDDLNFQSSLISIKIPNYSENNLNEYFAIRYSDKSPFYAIGNRLSIDTMEDTYVCYRGDCYISQYTHRINRNFLDPSAPINDKIVNPKCWQEGFIYKDGVLDMETFKKVNLGDVNAVELGQWITFTVRSNYNLCLRALDDSRPDEIALTGHPRSFYPNIPISSKGAYKTPEALCYNKGFEKSLSERVNFELPDMPAIKNDFTNRIAYSDINVNDAFKNGFRTFQGTHYRDYPKTYGLITKLVEWGGNLICVFEHGIALIPVNERTVAGNGPGGNVYINTSNVLPENPKIISDTFGSLWKDSIIKTPTGIYGVDTNSKKIWKTNGSDFLNISDFKVQEFLNLNISLTEREITPILGIRNVKTHYNKAKGDILFTFYDNLYGTNEKVWNLCYNELQLKFITFYSWVPSFSENIHNLFFSFDRNTSKNIAKLGISKEGSDFADGITLSNNIIPRSLLFGSIGTLHINNRNLPKGDNIEIIEGSKDPAADKISIIIKYVLEKDPLNNYKKFLIIENQAKTKLALSMIPLSNIYSEFYVRGLYKDNKYIPKVTEFPRDYNDWVINCVLNDNYVICKDENGRNIRLDKPYNPENLVTYLNIRADIKVHYGGVDLSLEEAKSLGLASGLLVDANQYRSTVAIIPEYNLQFLSTDFWKHGQSGIIDIADIIVPTNWYGKQHPFEFEFIVNDNPQVHKVFDNLEIISNSAEPESFHYEIIGDSYEFAKDKKNMYIRLEATKELYANNGCDVEYDPYYINLLAKHRPLILSNNALSSRYYDKSTLLPLYYSRLDSVNTIEDYYHLKDGGNTKDFSALAGGEITHDKTSDEYRIWNHAKAIDLRDAGRMRGNMHYKEDKWYIQINPLNLVLKNEPEWKNNLIPIELNQAPIPDLVIEHSKKFLGNIEIPENSKNRDIVVWKWEDSERKETKLRDKWIKIRIRYSGKKLAVISAIKTLYTISYG